MRAVEAKSIELEDAWMASAVQTVQASFEAIPHLIKELCLAHAQEWMTCICQHAVLLPHKDVLEAAIMGCTLTC